MNVVSGVSKKKNPILPSLVHLLVVLVVRTAILINKNSKFKTCAP
jgi:hypothetical protein